VVVGACLRRDILQTGSSEVRDGHGSPSAVGIEGVGCEPIERRAKVLGIACFLRPSRLCLPVCPLGYQANGIRRSSAVNAACQGWESVMVGRRILSAVHVGGFACSTWNMQARSAASVLLRTI
jgi:hypothetical protein